MEAPAGIIESAIRNGFQPRDNRPIYELAGQAISLSSPLTRTGRFDVTVSRHFIGPFDALVNHRVRTANVLMPPRGGKSLISDLWLWYRIRHSPCFFMWVFQDEKLAKFHKEERVKRILRSDPFLRPFVPEPYNGELKTVLGTGIIIDGPSLGNLTGRGVEALSLDEVWQWKQGMMGEAIARQDDYRRLKNEKLLVISQGGWPGTDWDVHYHAGLIHEWNVQCQECGKHFEPAWNGTREDGSFWGMIWDKKKDARGYWDIAKAVPTARYVCPFCGGSHIDTPRLKNNWNLTGKYVAEDSDKNDSKVSFRASNLIIKSHFDMVESYLSARNQLKNGSATALIQFWQKEMATFANENTVRQSQNNLQRAVYEINSDWPEEDFRLMSVDQQKGNLFYVTIGAWSARAHQRRRLFRGVVHGETELVRLQKRFGVPSRRVLIDSGDKPKGPGGAYAMAIRNGWLCTKGVGTAEGKQRPEIYRTVKQRHGPPLKVQSTFHDLAWGDPDTGCGKKAPLQRFDSDEVSRTLQGLIDSGFWLEPPDDGSPEEKDYREQMSAEFLNSDGKWECPSGRNHYRDCAKGETLGAILLGGIQDPMDNRTSSERAKEARN
jgi:hypothetical protein